MPVDSSLVMAASNAANSGTSGGGGAANVDWGGIGTGAGDLFSGLFGGIAALKGNAPNTYVTAVAPPATSPQSNNSWMMYAVGVVVFMVLVIGAYKLLK